MKNLQLAYEFYYWLPWWDRNPTIPARVLEYIVTHGVTTLEALIDEYERIGSRYEH